MVSPSSVCDKSCSNKQISQASPTKNGMGCLNEQQSEMPANATKGSKV